MAPKMSGAAPKGGEGKPRSIRIGASEVLTRGMPKAYLQDVYHYAMTLGWAAFVASCAAAFLALNAFFACLYMLGSGAIANQFPQGFLGCFFFSVETLATVGYGDMHPATAYAHWVSTVEIFAGMSSTALLTGAMFARFSRPKARIMFADHPVVGVVDGVPVLAVRAANARQNVIVDASAKLRLIRSEKTAEGVAIRRIYDLELRRDQHPMFILGWSLMHDIGPLSPLHGQDEASMAASGSTLVLTVDGVDETTSQHMQSRRTYAHGDVLWGRRYVDLFGTDAQGRSCMDYRLFHDTAEDEAFAKLAAGSSG